MRPNAAATPVLNVGSEGAPRAPQETDDDRFDDVAMGDQPHRNANDGSRDGHGAEGGYRQPQEQRAAERIVDSADGVAGDSAVEHFHRGNEQHRRCERAGKEAEDLTAPYGRQRQPAAICQRNVTARPQAP